MRFNALPRVFFFSTVTKSEKETYTKESFNALPRAFFFSTTPHPITMQDTNGEFQCPTTVFLLFYVARNGGRNEPGNVSMPYHGLSSFLHWGRINNLSTGIMFQCPTTGFLLFYPQKRLVVSTRLTTSFNALPRTFFFSTHRRTQEWIYAGYCVSMPYLGLSSFLRYVSASLEFTGFANPFLRVIIWQFHFQPFFSCYFPYSYFSHILFYFVRFP